MRCELHGAIHALCPSNESYTTSTDRGTAKAIYRAYNGQIDTPIYVDGLVFRHY